MLLGQFSNFLLVCWHTTHISGVKDEDVLVLYLMGLLGLFMEDSTSQNASNCMVKLGMKLSVKH